MLGRLEMVSMALERSRLGERLPVFLGVRVTVRILAHNFEELLLNARDSRRDRFVANYSRDRNRESKTAGLETRACLVTEVQS